MLVSEYRDAIVTLGRIYEALLCKAAEDHDVSVNDFVSLVEFVESEFSIVLEV